MQASADGTRSSGSPGNDTRAEVVAARAAHPPPRHCSRASVRLRLVRREPGADNAAAEAEFGIDTGQPIAKGFLFIDKQFIHGPYVVARRGLSIYINDHFIEMAIGMGENYQTELDPGDPPAGASPFDELPPADPRAAYWMQKWVYLTSHNDPATAREKMLELYRKSDYAKAIEPDADLAPTGYKVTLKSGETQLIDLNENWKTEVMPREFRLKTANDAKKRYESSLKGGQIVGYLSQGGYWQVSSAMAAPFFSILLSQSQDQAKIDQLVEKKLLMPKDQDLRQVLLAIVPDEELTTRVSMLTGKAPAPPVHTNDAAQQPPGGAKVATANPSAVALSAPQEGPPRTRTTSGLWLPRPHLTWPPPPPSCWVPAMGKGQPRPHARPSTTASTHPQGRRPLPPAHSGRDQEALGLAAPVR